MAFISLSASSAGNASRRALPCQLALCAGELRSYTFLYVPQLKINFLQNLAFWEEMCGGEVQETVRQMYDFQSNFTSVLHFCQEFARTLRNLQLLAPPPLF